MISTVDLRARLLRVAWWLFVFCAALAGLWLIVEAWRFAQVLPNHGWNFQFARIVVLVCLNFVLTALLASAAALYFWARKANALPDLRGWHLERPQSEFCANNLHEGYSLSDYLEQEDRIFDELKRLVDGPWSVGAAGAYSRFLAGSICNPETFTDRNWNRSLVLKADNPIGGVLLLHGLSDSPYSLRSLGMRLHREGYTVVWLRVPGHGTCPSALAHIDWSDWTAAVRIAMRGLRDLLPKELPVLIGGYSNGGALSVHYALSAIEDPQLPKPDGLVLFSPMLGINPLARITRLYHMVALIVRNNKAQWANIDAEIDPFKISSWPMNASVQAWRMTQVVERKLQRLQKAGRLQELPPVLAMQSVVDSTVVVPKLITVLFDRLQGSGNELFLFDINRSGTMANLVNLSFEKKILPILRKAGTAYKFSILQNAAADSPRVIISTGCGRGRVDTQTDMQWPDNVVSLSHIALPFSPLDPLYGTRQATQSSGLALGSLSMRAEPSALLISNAMFVRCRHNPFYDFTEDYVVAWLRKTLAT